MRIRLPTPRLLAMVATLLLGWGAIPHAPAEAKEVHTSDPGNQKKNKGKNGKKGGKNGKNGKNDNGVGPFKKKDYPVSSRLRPLVLPDGMGQVGAELDVSAAGGTTFAGIGVNFDYGVGDKVDFGASTGLLLAPDADWNKTLALRVHYLAYDTKDFDIAPGLLVPIYLYDGAPFGVVVDLPSRYVLSDGFFLRFGQGALPVGLSPDFTLALVANGGVGYQATPAFLLFLDTSVFTIQVAPDFAGTGIWDALGLDIGGQYSPTKDWDVGARLDVHNTWSVEKSFLWNLGIFGNYRF